MKQRALFGEDPLPPGLWMDSLSVDEQVEIFQDVQSIIREAPLLTPRMPSSGVPFRLRLTNAGSWGWLSDTTYRYSDKHPITQQPWPPIPLRILQLARVLAHKAGYEDFSPDSCLVNVYSEDGSLGLHKDSTENDMKAPIVSISLGDSCVFVWRGTDKRAKPRKFTLESGDCVVFGGPSRLAYHGVEKILPKTSPCFVPVATTDPLTGECSAQALAPLTGRVNLTIRKAR